jgi:hypothetical protein
MELERDTLDNLISYLMKHGYPEDSFAVEYNMNNYRADLAIIDKKMNTPLMIFEIKSKKSDQLREMGKKQLERIVGKFPTVPMYLVYPRNAEPYFEIERDENRPAPSNIARDYKKTIFC